MTSDLTISAFTSVELRLTRLLSYHSIFAYLLYLGENNKRNKCERDKGSCMTKINMHKTKTMMSHQKMDL